MRESSILCMKLSNYYPVSNYFYPIDKKSRKILQMEEQFP
jgi:hypothetical protein